MFCVKKSLIRPYILNVDIGIKLILVTTTTPRYDGHSK